MWSLTITLAFLLSASSSHGGLVRRSIRRNPFNSAKDLLSMKGASEAIKRSFKSAGSELEVLSRDLEQEVYEIEQLTAHIKHTEIEDMLKALAEAMDIQSVSEFLIFPFN